MLHFYPFTLPFSQIRSMIDFTGFFLYLIMFRWEKRNFDKSHNTYTLAHLWFGFVSLFHGVFAIAIVRIWWKVKISTSFLLLLFIRLVFSFYFFISKAKRNVDALCVSCWTSILLIFSEVNNELIRFWENFHSTQDHTMYNIYTQLAGE